MTFFLVGPFYPLRGGIAQYIGVLGQKLEQRGHRVKVLAFRKQFPKFLFPGQTQLESSREHIPLESDHVFVPWNPLSWFRTFLHARQGKPDALIFKYWMPFFAPGYAAVCALCKWFTPIKTIFVLDNVIPHEQRLGDRFFTRLAFRWVDGFIAQSEVVLTDLYRWFPEAKKRRVNLVAHPIYDCYSDTAGSKAEARGRLNLDPKGKLLLFFGLVRRYKGLDILLRSLPAVQSSLGSQIHLLVAGEFYEPEEDYTKIIRELELSDTVTIINKYISNEDVGLYFRAADVLVLPYRSATQSGVIQVAFNFGLPVISTRVGGIPEVIKDGVTGFLVDPESPEYLAKTIVQYFREEVEEKIRSNIVSGKDQYSWDEFMKVLENLDFEQKK
ncbi:MAG: glycosyltransferase [bacterium]|nr:glycosyltransferase [bacterium]